MAERSYILKNAKDLVPLYEKIAAAKIVLLGEASHGTHEYYTWRSAISKHLITNKQFQFIAVEGDWPDCYKLNRYVKGYGAQDQKAEAVLHEFRRWPTWMWANWEIVSLLNWLQENNRGQKNKCGFYGLDVYSLWESLETLIDYLKKTDPPAAKIADQVLGCFSGHQMDERVNARNALSSSCRSEVTRLLKEIRLRASNYNHDPEAELNTIQNAHIAVEAEKYYSNMMLFDDQTWNIRDRHMMDTLNRLLKFHGEHAKAIVWEHNTHVGDARYTPMKRSGTYNIGQLAREQYGEEKVFILGFGSYSGSVVAGTGWDSEMQKMKVPPALPGSVEEILHEESKENKLIIFDAKDTQGKFNRELPHRAIGVMYDPQNEYYNYVPSYMSKRYDAFIYLDETNALHPLHYAADKGQVPETYPFEF
jgi:erythromycin esterase-like protein